MIASDVYPRISYFKRFRMEIDLRDVPLDPGPLPEPFFFVPWDEALIPLHAEVKFQSFVDEIDSTVFPSLSSKQGCQALMREIRRKPGFLPEATWLISSRSECVGTVQGIREWTGFGAIQNLGILPGHRHHGLGRALLLQCLKGFQRAGVDRVFLEVTAQNEKAVRLYRQVGFRRRKTLYKAVDAANVSVDNYEVPNYTWLV